MSKQLGQLQIEFNSLLNFILDIFGQLIKIPLKSNPVLDRDFSFEQPLTKTSVI